MLLIISRTQMFQFMKEFVSFHKHYYLEWFEKPYPNVPLNQGYIPFFLRSMNVIQGTKP